MNNVPKNIQDGVKRHIIKESIIAGLIFLGVIFTLNLIAFKNEFIKPIKQEFEDFDIYDMVFCDKQRQQENIDHFGNTTSKIHHKNIVLVEAGKDRKEYLEQLQKLSSFEPKVLGVDIVLKEGILESKEDSINSKKLSKFLNSTPHIISGYKIDSIKYSEPVISNQPFVIKDSFKQNNYGYFNFIVSDNRNVIREFSPYYKSNSDIYYSFASQIVKHCNSVKWEEIEKHLHSSEYINYFGNIMQFDNWSLEEFKGIQKKDIKDKIVLFGGFSATNKFTEDLKFTPMNSYYSGRTNPDMYGIVIHANIINMLLDGNFIYNISTFWNALLVLLICILYSYLIIKDYKKYGHASHIKFIILSTILVFLTTWIMIELYKFQLVRFDLAPIIMAFFVPFELFEIYRRIALILHKYFNYQTTLSNH